MRFDGARRGRLGRAAVLCAALTAAAVAQGEERMIEDFSGTPETRWRFITDQVMGGVSAGKVTLEQDGAARFLRLRGTVSTANRGGFIQARLTPPAPLPDTAQGLELTVRGDGQRYFVHLRTRGTALPWQFHQAGFDTTQDWRVLRIPFAEFEPRGGLRDQTVMPGSVISVAVVAYGRDHVADLSVARIGTY